MNTFESKSFSIVLTVSSGSYTIQNQKTGKCLSIEGIGDWRPSETINCDELYFYGNWYYDESRRLRV